jgi:hypothetical protein
LLLLLSQAAAAYADAVSGAVADQLNSTTNATVNISQLMCDNTTIALTTNSSTNGTATNGTATAGRRLLMEGVYRALAQVKPVVRAVNGSLVNGTTVDLNVTTVGEVGGTA